MIKLFRNVSVDAECDSRTNISGLLDVGTFASFMQLKNVFGICPPQKADIFLYTMWYFPDIFNSLDSF